LVDNSIYAWTVPFGRIIAGFLVGLMLGIVGGWLAVIIYAMFGFPWSMEVQRNFYLIWIGIGAGAGAYSGWMNLNARKLLIFGLALIVIAGGVAGAYVGLVYGTITEPTYLGKRYSIDSAIHFGAPIGGIIAATGIGGVKHFFKLDN
tara:strand:- start:657 stop:1097 length:441 start_codon:yes stop_codon:yes gene_type:complete